MVKENKPVTSLNKEMPEEAIKFWYNDHDHIRSPFPAYIRDELQSKTLNSFFDWVQKVPEGTGKDLSDEIVAEKFEEILFETAAELVKTYDEKLTILYPFLPRLDDIIRENQKEDHQEVESIVIDRIHIKRGDQAFLKYKCRTIADSREWETEFELPE